MWRCKRTVSQSQRLDMVARLTKLFKVQKVRQVQRGKKRIGACSFWGIRNVSVPTES